MRKVKYLYTLCLLIFSQLVIAQYSGKSFDWNMDAYEKHTYSNSLGYMPYRLLKPTKIDPGKKYPLVIMLHGKGEGIGQQCTKEHGENVCNLLWGGKIHLDSINKYPSFVVFPQTHGGDWITDTPVKLLTGLLETLLKTYPIDLDRVSIHGLSGGGKGVWNYTYKYPALFSAISPHSASGDPTQAQRVLYTPIWNVQGGNDTEVKPQVSIEMMNQLRMLGQSPVMTLNETSQRQEWPNPYITGGQPIYSLIPKENHIAWPHLYNSPTWLNWMYSHSKNKIQVVGRTTISPGEVTKLGISAGFDAYEWSNGATSNQINVTKSGTYRVRYLRKKYFFSGQQVWSPWSDPVTITVSSSQGPQVNAGRDVSLNLPTNYIKIGGWAAGSRLTYSWTKVSGGSANLSNVNTSQLYVSGLQAGVYTFRLTVKDANGHTASDDVNLYVFDPNAAPSVKSFVLVNADNGRDIREIKNGDVIALSSLPTKNVNVRINTYPFNIGSVKSNYDGNTKMDNNAAYTLYGENDNKYYPAKLALGTHHLSSTPYMGMNASGTSGAAYAVSFSVVSSAKMITDWDSTATNGRLEADDDSNAVLLYPNPVAGDYVTLQFLAKQLNVVVDIYDQMGNRVQSDEVYMPGDYLGSQLDLHRLQPGIYRVIVSTDKIRNKVITIAKK